MDELIFLNPIYKRAVVPGPAADGVPCKLILPAEKVGIYVSNEAVICQKPKKDSAAVLVRGLPAQNQEVRKIYTVQKGEHLNLIARSCKCTVDDLRTWNGLASSSVKPGQKLIFYSTYAKPAVVAQAAAPVKTIAVVLPETTAVSKLPKNPDFPTLVGADKFVYYTIQKGDTLWTISQRSKTTVDEIKKMNGFGKVYRLMPGSKIRVARA
jgi:membrane-bound lytic murein transglycosylase D